MLINEKIKASELILTGLNNERIGIITRDEALALAKKLKADLVCTSIMSSPPPCKLVAKGTARQNIASTGKEALTHKTSLKIKEIRLTAHTEDHDYLTKQRQAEKLLASGHAVQWVIRLQQAKEGQKAKELLERMMSDLSAYGNKQSGIQVSGKQAAVLINPL
jgi:translation initiation factor IF-3